VVGFPGTGQTEFRNQSNKDIKINHVKFLYEIISRVQIKIMPSQGIYQFRH
jgi:hypothetical protein